METPFHLASQTNAFKLLRFTLRLQTLHLFFFPCCLGGPRSSRRGLLHVFHLPRRLRTHFFHIRCHERRARLKRKGVLSVRPMSYRSRPSQPLQHSRSFPFTLTSYQTVLFLYEYQGFLRPLLFQLPQLLENRFIVLSVALHLVIHKASQNSLNSSTSRISS